MIIQIWHSRNSDFQKELYEPIKNALFFTDHTWIFPHDGENIDSKESLKTVDLFIAEVSLPSTGLGIEIGFASNYEKRILCLYRKWSTISSSLKYVCEDFIEYKNTKDITRQIFTFLNHFLWQKN